MRVRVHEGGAGPAQIQRLLRAIGFDVVEVLPAVASPESGIADVSPDVELVFWDFSDSPDISAKEVRWLLRDPDLHRIPVIACIPAGQIGLEISVLDAGCQGVLCHPVTMDSVASVVASLGRKYATRMPMFSQDDTAAVVVACEDDSVREKVTSSLAQSGQLVLPAAAVDRVRFLLKRVGCDVAIVSEGLSGESPQDLESSIRGIQPGIELVVIGMDGTMGDKDLRKYGAAGCINSPYEPAKIVGCVDEVLRQGRDKRRSRMLAESISAKQRELHRANDSLRTINRAITDANARLERKGRQKDEVIGVVAHELKTPLSAIAGALDILNQEPARHTPDDQELILLMQRNVRRTVKLVDDILDLARVEAGRVQLRRQPVGLAVLVESAVSSIAMKARKKDVRFDLADDFPEMIVDVDEERIVQILVNLMDNAVKFSPGGSIVSINAKTTRDTLHIIVSDAGPGIPEDEQVAIFERFTRRARGDDPHSAGSGLGLTITRALASLHGGTVSVGTSPAGGARFTVSLPLVG